MFLFLNILYCADALENNKRLLIFSIASLEKSRDAEINSMNNLNNVLLRNINFDTSETTMSIQAKRTNIYAYNQLISSKKRELENLNDHLRCYITQLRH